MTRIFIIGAIAVTLGGCVTVESDFAFGSSDVEGFVDERFARIDAVIEKDIEDDKISGAVALVARDGKVVYHKAFGYSDIAAQDEMGTDAMFRIASMTKAITSVGVMMLYERGYFQLNDPVSKYLPQFAEPQVAVAYDDDGIVTETRPAKREIRIVDLLTHSAGISYGAFGGPLSPTYRAAEVSDGLTTANLTVAETMAVLAKQPLQFDPGERFEYGLNTDVLGYLVEVVSGKSLDEFFKDEIFEPLNMQDTFFYIPDDKANRLVTIYSDNETLEPSDGTSGTITVDPNYPIRGARTYFSGGAGLSSTASDYFRFVQMLLNNGELDGNRLLGRKSIELMRSPRIDMDRDGDADFGLGFSVTGDLGAAGEISSPSAYAWGGAFNTSYWIDPEERMVAVFMSNVFPYKTDIRARFRTAVYQALE
ncbi:MAG: serine hydrolase domain-containing protein [Woeseiaceae bacterium]